jgi:hypothetical protein
MYSRAISILLSSFVDAEASNSELAESLFIQAVSISATQNNARYWLACRTA